MIFGAIVLRPEPGNARTAARLQAVGVSATRCPLFAVAPIKWEPPDPARYDALLLTSANAVRHAGPGLRGLSPLPAVAVGAATAATAREAGLRVALTGTGGVAALVEAARAAGFERLLHLAGRDRVTSPAADAVIVYASDAVAIDPATVRGWAGRVALLHSTRAARRFAELVDAPDKRAAIGIAALSPAVLAAAGEGWAIHAAADLPRDAALVAVARALIDQPGLATDKRGR